MKTLVIKELLRATDAPIDSCFLTQYCAIKKDEEED
jgi:hypothetical protein